MAKKLSSKSAGRKAPIKVPSLAKRKEIRERLDRFRKHLRLTQEQFGQRAEVSSKNTIASWFAYRDPTTPSREALYVLGEKSNLNLNWLLWGDEPMLRVDAAHDADVTDKFRAYFVGEAAALGYRLSSLDKVLPKTELMRFLAERLLPEIRAEESMFPDAFREALKLSESDASHSASTRQSKRK